MSPEFIHIMQATCFACAFAGTVILLVYGVYRLCDWAHHGSSPRDTEDLP